MTQTPFQKDPNECLNYYRLELHDLRGGFKEIPGDSKGHASKKWWVQTQMLSFWNWHFFTIILSILGKHQNSQLFYLVSEDLGSL